MVADPPTARVAADQEAAHLEYAQLRAKAAELERTVNSLREQLRAAETHYAAALRVNEQRREDNDALRRLLVAVLPPDAVYQEARELIRGVRERGG